MRFLTSLKIPLIATFRDSQNFVQAAAAGIGVCELPKYRAHQDVPQIERVVSWLDRRRGKADRASRTESEAAVARHEGPPLEMSGLDVSRS
jgi:hypothetical protein